MSKKENENITIHVKEDGTIFLFWIISSFLICLKYIEDKLHAMRINNIMNKSHQVNIYSHYNVWRCIVINLSFLIYPNVRNTYFLIPYLKQRFICKEETDNKFFLKTISLLLLFNLRTFLFRLFKRFFNLKRIFNWFLNEVKDYVSFPWRVWNIFIAFTKTVILKQIYIFWVE